MTKLLIKNQQTSSLLFAFIAERSEVAAA